MKTNKTVLLILFGILAFFSTPVVNFYVIKHTNDDFLEKFNEKFIGREVTYEEQIEEYKFRADYYSSDGYKALIVRYQTMWSAVMWAIFPLLVNLKGRRELLVALSFSVASALWSDFGGEVYRVVVFALSIGLGYAANQKIRALYARHIAQE